MLEKIQTLWPIGDSEMTHSDLECPEYGQYPCEVTPSSAPNDSLSEPDSVLTDTWHNLVYHLGNDSKECENCLTFWTLMKNLACGGIEWSTVRDIVIQWCIENLPLHPDVCNGTVSIQGKHIYCIILQADPRHFCESINACSPPDDRTGRPPISERTPWAVKDKLLMEGKWPRKRSNNAKTPEVDKYVKIAALADVHVQINHVVGSAVECETDVCCLEDYPGNGSARYWGEYTCNLPLHTLQLFLERVRGIHPDFVIFAGDIPPHTMWDETETSQLNCSEIIVDAMTKTFGPDLRVYPAVGNHEMYPSNLFSTRIGETQRMIQRFTEIWSKPAGFNPTNNVTFSEMSYYTLPVPGHDKLRIVTINTELYWQEKIILNSPNLFRLFWECHPVSWRVLLLTVSVSRYTMNFYSTINEPIDENEHHKQWINNTLREARKNDEKVIVISHHPVGGSDVIVRSARWWEAIINEYHDVIVLHVSGHTHFDELKLNFNPLTMQAVGINHVAPSANTMSYINPSLVMYYLDPYNYSLIEYESFHLEIKDQDQSIGVPPAIAFGYSSREEYGMLDLSPESYRDLVLRFIEDDQLFQRYRQNMKSGAVPDEPCNYTCKVTDICNIWFPEFDEAMECVKYAPPPDQITTITEPSTTTIYVDTANTVVLNTITIWTLLISLYSF
ncbi:hypothetical protein LSH36_278g06048 [Paralvinella palmiformis]|uniref:Sphingomyelin phosphodiesterase n=1 Tax=Paralvinella palmiformis TaxID=53620 RepID=A0AAD9JKC4_9ANNE|nr:hypothetical protein LSH36_278g06048 [Paralvinella palmiformis]